MWSRRSGLDGGRSTGSLKDGFRLASEAGHPSPCRVGDLLSAIRGTKPHLDVGSTSLAVDVLGVGNVDHEEAEIAQVTLAEANKSETGMSPQGTRGATS